MISLLFLLLGCSDPAVPAPAASTPAAATPAAATPATRLHWFIPDGLRADPVTFDIFRWAQEGKLPHLQALMARGSYGYSIPAFPSHTPANFATLLTGATPEVHGVADGPMHVEGRPLVRPSVGGFSASARKKPAVWSLLEAGRKVFLLSVPGSTPPELAPGGITVRGRWGGWGADVPAVLFESASVERRTEMARSAKLFLVGEDLTRFVTARAAAPWSLAPALSLPTSAVPPLEIDLTALEVPLFGLLVDGTADGRPAYDRLVLSRDRREVIATLAAGKWSDWVPVTIRWKEVDVASHQRLELIRVGEDGSFRVRMLFDALNRLVAEPPEVADALVAELGPMVDYVDSYPAQLVYYPEDKQAFLDEAKQSLDWHRGAVDAVYRRYNPDVFVHSTYTPNQTLTSRWWMGFLDPVSRRYPEKSDAERQLLWDEVLTMYRQIDDTLGRAVANAGPDGLVVFSSDHGAIPLDRWVRLNNLFAAKGWLSVIEDPITPGPEVDWEQSQVVFLNTNHVYIDPEGLGGDWHRASGPAYDTLRAEVVAALTALREGEVAPVERVTPWEKAEEILDLPADRVGDLVLTIVPGYAWNEEMTPDGALFGEPRVTGYKQAVSAETTRGLWTPFVIAGPGVRASHRIVEPIHAIDQLPTILRAMGQPVPTHVQGRAVEEILGTGPNPAPEAGG